MATPLKLGLAGGPLIIAILAGAYGYKFHLVTYTTTSANLLLREIGLILFLAAVGIKAGSNFWDTVVQGDGLTYVWVGFLVTIVPLLIMGAFYAGYTVFRTCNHQAVANLNTQRTVCKKVHALTGNTGYVYTIH